MPRHRVERDAGMVHGPLARMYVTHQHERIIIGAGGCGAQDIVCLCCLVRALTRQVRELLRLRLVLHAVEGRYVYRCAAPRQLMQAHQ